MVRPVVHVLLHFLVPGAVSRILYNDRWKSAWLIMVLTMVIDFDHLLSNPIYDPNRCGIGFHPLHSYAAAGAYLLMIAVPKIRIVGIGLVIHLALDGVDCIWMS